ncbi:Cell growth-regulating nucleolar protein [Plasmopara halstedii]|uniref:Cell growth-regulating nucleolar protein n=1 Tax=Plasmopara halstedii TaxID=4781 RepID=A0A0P1AJI4_PLAHL|nr:Cell growth-regulating nucleolar protein [Plasmopara halstedii]CEG40774.1 Cell growth-regulating nucleolar protein [Plasmopara halstedii]|eukprot:XP_024577143.1 Cell growth-regulating nucleolar protein [Plasmopara halstedii]
MVFFVCEGCNETLKKNKVDAHAGRCRNCWAVSCVDCSIVFEGNDYAAHTSCISEAEKYEKTLYQGDKNKKSSGKKKTPQERWMDVVQSATCPEDRKVQDVLTRIAGYDNVPRKKNKFVNFVSNSLAMRDTTLVEKAWIIYETAFKKAAVVADDGTTVGAEEAVNKKRPSEDTVEETINKKSKTKVKTFKWKKLIKSALKVASKEMEMHALRDRLIEQIQKQKLSSKSVKELRKEFKIAIKESDKFVVVETVRLK